MKTIMSKSPHDSSFSLSKRYFNWKKKVESEDEDDDEEAEADNDDSDEEEDCKVSTFSLSSRFNEEDKKENELKKQKQPTKKKLSSSSSSSSKSKFIVSVSKLIFNRIRPNRNNGGREMVGTLFGNRRGHVYFALQQDPKQNPTFLIELSTPTSVLVKEMASGFVRIALECEKKETEKKKKMKKLVEEGLWRTFCNGKKCGYAMKRECGEEEWKILKAVEPITMGAGVLPVKKKMKMKIKKGNGANGSEIETEIEGEIMYMRARFERVIGSKDSEAFYMMNPDFSGGPDPELSVYLLRV